MKQYKYEAVNLKKEKFTGVFSAKDEQDLAEQLIKQNLYLVSCKVYSSATPNSFFTLGTGKITLEELTMFCQQFSIMLSSGIPLLDCIDGLRTQSFSSYFRKILQIVYEDVKSGEMFSEALDKHKKAFPVFFRSMVRVGELSGNLEAVFESLAKYYDTDSKVRRKVKGALAYPIMLVCLTVGIVALMLLFIIPTFRKALASLNLPIKGLTKVVYDMSDFLLANWTYVLAGIVVVILLLWAIGKTKKGRYAYDWLKLRLPFYGKVQRNLITSRFAKGFGLLLMSGMDVSSALDSIVVLLGNKELEKRFLAAAEEVRHGVSLSEAFGKYKVFPNVMLQMLAVGEKTASIESVLLRSCDYFDAQVETSITAAVNKIQPIMLLIMGVVIATLFLAVYSPMLDIMGGLNQKQEVALWN